MSDVDTQLLQSFALMRRGDSSGLASLYALTSRHLYAIIKSVLGSDNAANDVLKALYMKLWRDRAVANAYTGWTLKDLAILAHRMAIDAKYADTANVLPDPANGAPPMNLSGKGGGVSNDQ